MSKNTFTIGRAGDVKLNDETVSRRHACLEVDGDSLVLRDLDSRSGVFEVLDSELIPFSEGPVRPDQVFAFGECVRSVAQLWKTAVLQSASAKSVLNDREEGGEDPLEATSYGTPATPHRRLDHADITQMLDHAEDELAQGRTTSEICMNLGITIQRYERWCREYGATRRERNESVALLRRENERLRKLVAELSEQRRG